MKTFDFRKQVDESQQGDLIEVVSAIIAQTQTRKETISKEPSDDLQMSAQEVNELAQRRFLRQAVSFATESESGDFPLLSVLDCEVSSEPYVSNGTSIIEILLSQNLVFRCLCEHEFGWHLTDDAPVPFRVSPQAKGDLIKCASVYLYRIYTLLNSSHVPLHIFKKFEPNKLILALFQHFRDESAVHHQEENRSESTKVSYISLRNKFQETSSNSHGTLLRCLLPSGKVSWLCPKHQKEPHVTIMSGTGPSKGSIYMKSILNEHDMNVKEELGKLTQEWSDQDIGNQVYQKGKTPPQNDGKRRTSVKSKMCSIS